MEFVLMALIGLGGVIVLVPSLLLLGTSYAVYRNCPLKKLSAFL